MAEEYTCAMCGKVYEKTWSDEEAMEEMRGYFGDIPMSECDVVCDDCFQAIHPATHPAEVAKAKTEHGQNPTTANGPPGGR
jgi:hypothetical protein